jgi:hypothetical protein
MIWDLIAAEIVGWIAKIRLTNKKQAYTTLANFSRSQVRDQ